MVVPRPAFHLSDQHLGEVLGLRIQSGTTPRPLAATGLPIKGATQRFILAVLQHRHPPVQMVGVLGTGGRVGGLSSLPHALPQPLRAQSWHSRLTLQLVLRMEVVCAVICGVEKRPSRPPILQAFPRTNTCVPRDQARSATASRSHLRSRTPARLSA